MSGEGGEIRAAFEAAKEEAAQIAEQTGQKIAEFTSTTSEGVLDSVQAVQDADGAATDAAHGIHGEPENIPPSAASAGDSALNRLLNGGDDPKLKPGTPEYEQYANELARDPAHAGEVKPKTLREAAVGINAEADGDLPGPLTRTPFSADGRDQGEFTDAAGRRWDVKSSPDVQPDYGRNPGQPLRRYQSDADFTDMVNHELEQGTNVLLDPHGMTPGRLSHLRGLVADHPEWGGKVIWGR